MLKEILVLTRSTAPLEETRVILHFLLHFLLGFIAVVFFSAKF